MHESCVIILQTPWKCLMQIEEWEKKLESVFVSLERLTGLRVTLNDIHGFFCDRDGKSFISPDRIYHALDFCQRADRKKCIEHECKNANNVAIRKDSTFLWHCWKGPLQIAVPLKWHEQHVGIIFIGPFLPAQGSGNREQDGVTADAIESLPCYDMNRFVHDSALLDAIGKGIVENTNSVKIHGKGERWEKIYRLYTGRVAEKLGIGNVAKELNVSNSRASHVVTELFGMPFESLLLDYRLHRVAALLESTDLLLSEIAELTGFCDIYHMSKMFKRKYAVPPGAYRKKQNVRLASTATDR